MKQGYDTSLAAVLRSEGGYVNDPRDPGGATNKGVTQAVYDDYRKGLGSPPRTVKQITPSETAAIYKHRYWDAVRGDDLPAGVDYAVFDLAVNSGVSRASRFLQDVCCVNADGKIGPVTIAAASHNPKHIVEALMDKRLAFLRTLGTFGHFGKGWTNRCNEVRATALGMVA
jgi:lysozyme family protein